MATLGSLLWRLGLDDKKYRDGLKRAGRSNKKFSRNAQKDFRKANKGFGGLLASIGKFRGAIAGIAAAGGLSLLIKSSIDAADKIGKTADAIGLSTDALQEYRFAADIAGVATEDLDKAVSGFAKRLGEVRTTGQGTLFTALDKLDRPFLNALIGTRNLEDALSLLFKKMEATANQSDRVALSAAAFGRSAGIQMAVLVKNGADEIDNLRQRARDLGVVLSEDLIRKSEDAKDRITEFATVLKTQVTSAVIELSPQIGRLASEFTNLVQFFKKSGDFKFLDLEDTRSEIASLEIRLGKLNTILKNTSGSVGPRFAFSSISRLEKEIKRVDTLLSGLRAKEQRLNKELFPKPKDQSAAKSTISDIVEQESAYSSLIETMQRQLQIANSTIQARADLTRQFKIQDAVRKALSAAEKDGIVLSKEQLRRVRELTAGIIDATAAEKKRVLVEQEGIAATEKIIGFADGIKQSLKDNNTLLSDFAAKLEEARAAGKLTFEQVTTASENFRLSLEENKKEIFNMKDTILDFKSIFSNALADMIVEGEFTFKALGKSLIKNFLSKLISFGLGSLPGFSFQGGDKPIGFNQSAGDFDSGGSSLLRDVSRFSDSKRGGGGIGNVTVINNTGSQATVTKTPGSNGLRDIKVTIENVIAGNILGGGGVTKAIQSRFGLNPAAGTR